jgi:2-dehydropantoate 2-reductase
MACSFSARLARAGAAVTLAGSWREGLDAIAERGILVEDEGASPWRAQVAAQPLDRIDGRWPAALVLVKSGGTGAAASGLARTLDPTGLALTLQNGLGNLETLAAALSPARVAAGAAIAGARLLAPGHVLCVGARVVLGAGDARRLRRAGLLQLLVAAGIDVELTANLEAALWRKLAANCAINPLTALHGLTNGDLATSEPLRPQIEQAAGEVAAVAAARGISLGADAAETALAAARETASNRSSMLADLLRGAPTEIDALCGAVVREGRRLGVATPVNARLWRLVRECEGRPLEDAA